jgi:hypothetical protein
LESKEGIMNVNDNPDHILEDENKKSNMLGISIMLMFFVAIIACVAGCCLTSCTISMSNTSTEGTASDVGDATPTNTPTVSTTLSVPAKAL